MNDYADAAEAVKTTVASLQASGVDSVAIAVSLIAAASHVYRDELCDEDLSPEDLHLLIRTVTTPKSLAQE